MRQKKAELERRRIAAAIAEQRAKEDMAALKIQSMARRWQARKMVRDKLESREAELRRQQQERQEKASVA